MNFSLGQRWISDTESDLGLGTIVALEGRQVTILFPQAEKTVFILLKRHLLLGLCSTQETPFATLRNGN